MTEPADQIVLTRRFTSVDAKPAMEYRGKRGTAVKALELVISLQCELLEAWRDIHGES